MIRAGNSPRFANDRGGGRRSGEGLGSGEHTGGRLKIPAPLASRWLAAGPLGAGILVCSVLGQVPAANQADNRYSPDTTAFVGVHLLTMERETVLADQVLVVEDGRVARFGPRATAEIPPQARRIDAAGLYLLPGLVDVHTHAREEALPLYLASGVTTVRTMHGYPERLDHRRRQLAEAVPWPNILTAGPLIAGEEVPWPAVIVETPEAARRVAREHARAGYDFLKVYDGLTGPVYDALVEEARELGIPFSGHLPAAVGVRRVLEAGQQTIEHAEQLLYATFGRAGIMELPVARTDSVVHLFERYGRGTCLTPTLWGMTLAMRRGTPFTDSLFERLDWGLVDPELEEWWRTYRSPAAESARPRREHFLQVQRALTRRLHAAGVPLLAGTDAPYPLLVPGASLVQEVRTLADLGLSRFEALAAATRNPGLCFGSDDGFRVVRPGARADLLLLGANPLADLTALERPKGVMVRGRWYDEPALAELPDRVREAYSVAAEPRPSRDP